MSDLITNLGINWKILIAQTVNFAILLFILQRFLYRPILKMLDARHHEIKTAHENAKEVEQRLKDAESAKEEVLAGARTKATAMIRQAEADAARAAEKIVTDAKADAARAALDEKQKMIRERDLLMQEAKKHLGATIAMAVEKSVGDIFDDKGKARMSEQALAAAEHIKN